MTAQTKPTSAAIEAAHQYQAPALSGAPVASLTPMEMIDRALANGAGIDTLEKLMALQERWEANQGRRAFNEAIAAARGEMPQVVKGSTADRGARGGTYAYETMSTIASAIDPVLAAHGLSYRFRTETKGDRIHVTCIVSHRDGYSEETTLDAPKDDSGGKNVVQSIGSTVTYLQRYTLKAALGIASGKDDDARGRRMDPSEAQQISADEFRALRARIDAQGDAADQVEAYLLKRFGVEVLDVITTKQHAEAMQLIAQRERRHA